MDSCGPTAALSEVFVQDLFFFLLLFFLLLVKQTGKSCGRLIIIQRAYSYLRNLKFTLGIILC